MARLDRNIAPCIMPTTNVIGPLHECKKVCSYMHKSPTLFRVSRMNQARSDEEETRGRVTEARRLIKRKAAQQNNNQSEELKQGLDTSKVDKAGGRMPNFP